MVKNISRKFSSGFTIIELLVVVTMLFAAIFGIGMIASGVTIDKGDFTISDGSRVGVVTKFSHKGLFSFTKTWEGDLLLGGAGTVTQSHWNFTVNDEDLAKKVEEARSHSTPVELGYHKYLWCLGMNGETCYFINSVTLVKKITAPMAPTAN